MAQSPLVPFVFSLNTVGLNQQTPISTPQKKIIPPAVNKKHRVKQSPKKPTQTIKKISTPPKVQPKKPAPNGAKTDATKNTPETKKPVAPRSAQSLEKKKAVAEPVVKKAVDTVATPGAAAPIKPSQTTVTPSEASATPLIPASLTAAAVTSEIPREVIACANKTALPTNMPQAQSFAVQSNARAHQQGEASDSLYTKVCSAISENWHMPAGMQPPSVCKLIVALAFDGKPKTITLDTSSGIVVYDLAAQAAARRATYPKEVWGKDLILLFN